MDSLKNILAIRSRPGLSRSINAAVILAKVNGVRSKAEEGRWIATVFRAGKLTVVGASPSTCQNLAMRKTELIDRLNTELKQALIKEIFIRKA